MWHPRVEESRGDVFTVAEGESLAKSVRSIVVCVWNAESGLCMLFLVSVSSCLISWSVVLMYAKNLG